MGSLDSKPFNGRLLKKSGASLGPNSSTALTAWGMRKGAITVTIPLLAIFGGGGPIVITSGLHHYHLTAILYQACIANVPKERTCTHMRTDSYTRPKPQVLTESPDHVKKTLKPQKKTQNPKPWTLNPKP